MKILILITLINIINLSNNIAECENQIEIKEKNVKENKLKSIKNIAEINEKLKMKINK